MSIATELTNYATYLTNAYDKCTDKGATIPANKNLQNLTDCIDSIMPIIPYQKLSYLESTGTQYIDTGIVPKSTTRMVIEVAQTNVTTGYDMGWSSSGGQEAFIVSASTNQQAYTAFCSRNYSETASNIPLDTNKHIFDISNNAIKIDGTTFGQGNIQNTATSTQTIYLFSLHSEWSPYINNQTAKIYSCKLYDGATLVRDFVPAKRKSDNKVGLLDLVNLQFYTNNGSGDFSYA